MKFDSFGIFLSEKIKGGLLNSYIRRNPFFYGAILKTFETMERATLEQRKSWTQKRLRATLEKAAKTVYGASTGGGADIESWPVLEKTSIQNKPETFMTRPKPLTSPGRTSGSTGTPLRLYRSFCSVTAEQASFDHALARHGVDNRRARVAFLTGADVKDPNDTTPPFWKFSSDRMKLLLSSNHLTADSISSYCDILRKYNPDYITAYPSSLETMLTLMLSRGERLDIPLVMTYAEVLPGQVRDLAREVLGCEILDQYGTAERVVFAWAIQPGRHFFLPGYSYIELEPAESEEEGDLYELIGTGLWNMAMPLVRYRTGDLLLLPKGLSDEELGRIKYGVDPFMGVRGRKVEYLVSPDGSRIFGLYRMLQFSSGIMRTQIIQESRTRVRLLIRPIGSFTEKDKNMLLELVRKKLPASMVVEMETTDTFERTKSGKTPFIIKRPGVDGAPGDDQRSVS